MKKIILTLVILILICCALLFSCKTPAKTEINFPNHEFGKTEHNAEIYDIEPFILNIEFPVNWEVVYPKTKEDAKSGISTVSIYSDESFVCDISYNTFKLYKDTTEENFYRSVYNQIMLGSVVTWDNNYTPIKSDDFSSTAICDVSVNSPLEKFTFPGILSYNSELLTYISISFDGCEINVSDEILENIANSIQLSR